MAFLVWSRHLDALFDRGGVGSTLTPELCLTVTYALSPSVVAFNIFVAVSERKLLKYHFQTFFSMCCQKKDRKHDSVFDFADIYYRRIGNILEHLMVYVSCNVSNLQAGRKTMQS